MKKLFSIILGLVLPLVFAGSVSAAPAGNPAGAQKIPWNLSGAVMPVPPYGLSDIPGSDTASKLIVNQPNGKTKAVITGVMKGLNPNTEYTVYLSNAWSSSTMWNVSGSYVINVRYLDIDYPEDLVLQQSGSGITGTSLALVGGGASPWTIDSGSVVGNIINFRAHFNAVPTLHANFSGTIAEDGSIINGSWADESPGTRTGTWATTSGKANSQIIGDGWPGLFGSLQPFTFVTDEFGAGSWHLNLKAGDFPTTGAPYALSVWINGGGGTILISDNFTLGGEHHHGCSYHGRDYPRFHFGAGHCHWWCGWGF